MLIKKQFLSNSMLLGNFVANLGGVAFVEIILRLAMSTSGRTPPSRLLLLAAILRAATLFFTFVIQLIYEQPIRKALQRLRQDLPLDTQDINSARRRLLNEPYFAIGVDLLSWGITALILGLVAANTLDASPQLGYRMVARTLVTGLITAAIAFFVLENVLQRLMIPIFFPQGGLAEVGGVIRITIATRLVALILAASIVPLVTVLLTIYASAQAVTVSGRAPEEILPTLQVVVTALIVVFIFNAIALAFLVAANLTRPLREIMSVIQEIKLGKLDSKVRVLGNDEIGYTGEAVNLMLEGLLDRERIKDTFGKYVGPEVRDEILSKRSPLDGEIKTVTVLFSDLRDFTPLVYSKTPQEVVGIINYYFGEMSNAIQSEGGLVLQFIGDEIEAVFGAPLSLADHADCAIKAAMKMRDSLKVANQSLAERGLPTLRHGIGIHTGLVLAANIGSPNRLSYALVGNTVNLASRIQGLTKQLGHEIIISGTTMEALRNKFDLLALTSSKVKGIDDPVKVFAVA